MMHLSIRISLLLLISSLLISCNAQVKPESKQTENVKQTENEMLGKKVSELDDQIWKVFHDSKGNYWFGSNGKGVYHFDGKDLILYTSEDGLVHNQIRGIQEDSKGNVYIETVNGISKYDGTAFKTLEVTLLAENSWRLDPNDLWFGYNTPDVYRYDGSLLYQLVLPKQDLKTAFGIEVENSRFSPYAVYGINKDKEGNLWIGSGSAGAFRYDGSSFLWFGEKELSTLPDGRVPAVRSMIEDKDGYFWLSNFCSKYKVDPEMPLGYEKLKAVDLPKDIEKDRILYFNSGLSDTEGNLWMTTYGGGVWKYDGHSLSLLELKSGHEELLLVSIFQDNQGVLWLGTDNDGVYKQDGDSFKKFDPIR